MLNIDIDMTSDAYGVYALLKLYFDVVLDTNKLGQPGLPQACIFSLLVTL